MPTGTASGSSHPSGPMNPLASSYGSEKYVSRPEPHSKSSCAHHHRDGGEPEGKRTTALLSAPTEIAQALTSNSAGPSGSAGTKPRRFTPAATLATIRHHPTGLAGWRRVIG